MKRFKICDTSYGEKLFGALSTGRVIAWTFCDLIARIPLPTLDDPANLQTQGIKMWVQVPVESIRNALAKGQKHLELAGKTNAEAGLEIDLLSFQECREFGLDWYSQEKFFRNISDLYISEDDLERIKNRPSLLRGTSRPRKKRQDGADTEILIDAALNKLLAEHSYKRDDPIFKTLYKPKTGISVTALMNLILKEQKGYGLKRNEGCAQNQKWVLQIPQFTLRNHLQKKKKKGELDKLFSFSRPVSSKPRS